MNPQIKSMQANWSLDGLSPTLSLDQFLSNGRVDVELKLSFRSLSPPIERPLNCNLGLVKSVLCQIADVKENIEF